MDPETKQLVCYAIGVYYCSPDGKEFIKTFGPLVHPDANSFWFAFYEFLLTKSHSGYRFYAHNLARFDGPLLTYGSSFLSSTALGRKFKVYVT